MFKRPENLEIPPQLQEGEATSARLTQGGGEEAELIYLLKRTYQLDDAGRVTLAGDGALEPLWSDEQLYDDELLPPLVSPVQLGHDSCALKEATDVVIQAAAHAYDGPVRSTSVVARFGPVEREIRVFGDRRGVHDAFDRPRFTDPAPFTRMPIRYDRAYGGQDRTARRRYGFLEAEMFRSAAPELELDRHTPYHYPRNPAGVGYLVQLDRESFEGLAIPNLELPADPLTPDRLAAGSLGGWIDGPLPAGFDWQASGWFPRIAYLGLAPPHDPPKRMLAEQRLGWVAPDLLSIESLLRDLARPIRPEFTQAASPGMAVKGLRADEAFELRGLHARVPVLRFELPGEVPAVEVKVAGQRATPLAPHLASVILRLPGGFAARRSDLVMVWAARGPLARKLTPAELEGARTTVMWRKGAGARRD